MAIGTVSNSFYSSVHNPQIHFIWMTSHTVSHLWILQTWNSLLWNLKSHRNKQWYIREHNSNLCHEESLEQGWSQQHRNVHAPPAACAASACGTWGLLLEQIQWQRKVGLVSGSTNVVQPGMGGLRLSQIHAFLSVPSQYPETIQNVVAVVVVVVTSSSSSSYKADSWRKINKC